MIAPAAAGWAIVYALLPGMAGLLTYRVLGLDRGTRTAAAVEFFAYDGPKVLMLLLLVVYAMGVVRTYFSPGRTRRPLAGRAEFTGSVGAACLGIVPPFTRNGLRRSGSWRRRRSSSTASFASPAAF